MSPLALAYDQMPYTLFNIRDNKQLKHPADSVWRINDRKDAEAALLDLYDYLDAAKIEYLKEDFTVMEINVD